MGYRKVPLIQGEYFHVYNRGNSKQEIFLDDEDRDRFIKMLYLYNSQKNVRFRDNIINIKIDAFDFDRGETIVSIGAWVLMPNHFHIYISPTSPTPGVGESKKESPVALFLRKVCVGYSKYFNNKYGRTGSLFEGRFKATHIFNDNQAKYLFSYIHLNPIKLIQSDWKDVGIKDVNKTIEFLKSYKWGSYQDYLGVKRKESKILNRENFLDYFNSIENFNKEILEWIKFKDK